MDASAAGNELFAATIGVFDGVHLGHQWLLSHLKSAAKERGLATKVVAINKSPKGPLSGEAAGEITPPEMKERLLRQCGIDTVWTMDFTPQIGRLTAREFLRELHERHGVNALVAGFNNRIGSDHANFEMLQSIDEGIEVIAVPEYSGAEAPVSSSIIRRLISEGQVEKAAGKMGRYLLRRGVVAHGQHRGTGLGFPTANVVCRSGMMPKRGAYAVRAAIDDGGARRTHHAMANIGIRPTMGHFEETTFEVNIFGFEGDLYGKEIEVEFVARLRDERKMESADELARQLASDRQRASAILSARKL